MEKSPAAMIPTREQLDELACRRQGTLQEAPFAVLLCALAANRQTAVLELRRHQIAKRIVFELGVPVDCRSNLVHETLGRFLVGKGLITAEQNRETLNEAANHGVPQGEVLRAHLLIDAYELYRRLQENLAKKLLDGFTWREGEFRLLFDVPPVESPLKVKVPQLVTTGVSRFSSQEEINAGVAPLIGRPLTLHPQPPFPLPEIRLTPSQLRLAQALRKPQRLDELAEATGLDFNTVSRELYALAVVGAVVPEASLAPDLRDSGPVAITAEDRSRSETGALAVGRMDPDEVERRRNEIMEAYLAHRRQDAFDLLGLPDEATLPAMEEAYLEYCRRCAPWQFENEALRPLGDKARELFLTGATAYAQLVDSEQRNALLYHRQAQRREKTTQPTQHAFQIQTDLLDPQLQFRRGRLLMEQGKYLEALELLDFASDCDPQNGAYRAEAAYCRYRYSPRVNTNKALESLRETLRIDPHCGAAHLYLGELLASKDEVAAREHLEEALQRLPDDPRPRELLRTLPE